MPFTSDKQRAYLYKFHPDIAKRWRKESGPQMDLPTYAHKSDSSKKPLEGLKRAKK
jgi:hypothetical protein